MNLRYRALMEQRLAGQTCPRVPVLFWKHHPVADQDGAALCRATLEFQTRFDCDVIKVSPAATYQLPDYGLHDAWRGDPIGRREVVKAVIDRPEQWHGLPAVDPRRGFVARFGDCVHMVRREAPAEVPVIVTVFDPMSQAVPLAGLTQVQAHLRDAPDAVEVGLRQITENTVELIAYLLERGADGIFLASQYAGRGVLPWRSFERYGLPAMVDCLDAMAPAALNMVHLHGGAVHEQLFTRFPGHTIHYDMWADNPPPGHLLDLGCAVATGPAQELLASDTPDREVMAACEPVVDAVGRTVLSPGCSTPLAVDDRRLRLLFDAACGLDQTRGTA